MAQKNTKTQSDKKKTVKKTQTGEVKPKKMSVSIEKALYENLTEYIENFGYSKDSFISEAIREKLDRDQISRMIDTMIKS